MKLVQKNIILKPKERGVHLVTQEIVTQLPEIREFKTALLHLFLQHTSAALTINENADPDVRTDTQTFMDELIPDGYSKFTHILEGHDDMPAHIKSMLFGCQLTIPVANGRLALGTWQGVYLIEARNYAGSRRLVATLQGNMV